MERHGITPAEAFAELRGQARNSNTTVVDLAEAVVVSYPLFRARHTPTTSARRQAHEPRPARPERASALPAALPPNAVAPPADNKPNALAPAAPVGCRARRQRGGRAAGPGSPDGTTVLGRGGAGLPLISSAQRRALERAGGPARQW